MPLSERPITMTCPLTDYGTEDSAT